jgi:L,D-peptidoglycan transpeptidase YkuD (ErfK/YbiS/YcfS/YnhG family)
MLITRRHAIGVASIACGAALSGCTGFSMPAGADTIDVSAAVGSTNGTLRFGGLEYPCALGRSGILDRKREGDGGTPAGLFPLREVRYRPDVFSSPPQTGLPEFPAKPTDGWCDDPEDPAYNKIVRLPYQTDAEKMWRDDHVYDLLAVIGYNDAPPIPGLGSAVFLHVARPDGDGGKFLPTAGCVAVKVENLLAILARCTPATMIRIRTV